jgi:hypothetical protein
MNRKDGPESQPGKEVLPWLGPLLLMVSIGLLAEAAYHWWPRTVDDAFITFRYAQNLVDGLGPVYNPGERVEGYSSPIWMLGSAAVIALGIDPVVASKWAGLLCAGALSVAVYVALRATGARSWGAGLATGAVGGSFVLQLWSTSGMETAAYAASFFVALAIASCIGKTVRGALWVSAFLAAASLTRPEGLMFWGIGFLLYLGGVRTQPRRLLAYALPGLAIASHFAFRFAYYGSLFPNTYYAKTGGGPRMWSQGLDRLTGFLSEPAIAILMSVAFVGFVMGLSKRETRHAAALMGGAALIHLVYVVSVGDDGLFKYRFYVPIVGPLAFLVGLLFHAPAAVPMSRATPLDRLLAGLGALAIFIAVPLSVSQFHSEALPGLRGGMLQYLEGNIKLGRHLAATRGPDTVIAVPSAGAIPFYSRLPTIDMYGLNDAHIARVRFRDGVPGRMMKWDNAYVLSQSPDVIVLNRGYQRSGEPRRRSLAPMDRDLVNRLRSDRRYARTSIRFDDGSSFDVYERVSGAVQ